MLVKFPPGFVADLPREDQVAISDIVGKPNMLIGYDDTGRAELEFNDANGVTHSIWVKPQFIRHAK
jgi:hypothetical protein